MTLAATVIDKARWHLLNGRRELASSLAADLTASPTATTITFPAGGIVGLVAGNVLEVGAELMYVSAYTTGATTATVVRGYGGSTEAHYIGEVIRVNPVVPTWILLSKMNSVLSSVSAAPNGLHRMLYVDFSASSGRTGYNLDVVDQFHDVWAVRQRTDAIGSWPIHPGGWGFMRDASLTDFPSGYGIVFDQPPAPYTTRVWYRAGFGELTGIDNDIEAQTGFPSTALDLLELGAAMLAVEGREITRAEANNQPDTRRAAEIPVGGATNSTARLERRYNARLMEEAQRFLTQWDWLRQ